LEHPELGIRDGQEWFGYRSTLILVLGGDVETTFLNEIWHVRVRTGLRPPWPTNPVWFLLRRRGEASATFCAVKDRNGVFRQIGVDEFGIVYQENARPCHGPYVNTAHGFALLSRKLLLSTDTELKAIAAAAIIGLSKMPKKG